MIWIAAIGTLNPANSNNAESICKSRCFEISCSCDAKVFLWW